MTGVMSGISSSYLSLFGRNASSGLTPFIKPSGGLNLKCLEAIKAIALSYEAFCDCDCASSRGDTT
jgi:hypothetical protein